MSLKYEPSLEPLHVSVSRTRHRRTLTYQNEPAVFHETVRRLRVWGVIEGTVRWSHSFSYIDNQVFDNVHCWATVTGPQ